MNLEPADEDSSFAVGKAQHGKDPLKELGWKFVYICHNLHLQLLEVTQPLEYPKTTVSGGKLRPVVHKQGEGRESQQLIASISVRENSKSVFCRDSAGWARHRRHSG